MRKSMYSTIAAAMLLASAGIASAQTTTTTTSTWTNDQGTTIREYSTTRKYSSYMDPTLKPVVGMELPANVTLYTLPETMRVPAAEHYRYAMINNNPVVVESTTRRVVHSWNNVAPGD